MAFADDLTEQVLLQDHSIFSECLLPWTHLYEIARFFQAASVKERDNIDLAHWARLAAPATNPADLRDLLKVTKPPLAISPSVNLAFQRATIDDLPRLQKSIAGHIIIDLPTKGTELFKTRLSPPEFAKPNELVRKYGADKFLIAKLSDQLLRRLRVSPALQQTFKKFCHCPFRIGNRRFFMFIRKEGTLRLVWTPEDDWLSVKYFINNLLNLQLNKNLSIAKWVSRMTLIISATNPTLDFEPQNIHRVPDLYTDSLIISRDLLDQVIEGLGLTYCPSAIQGIIKSTKFIWRLGRPDEIKPGLIQLWDCQIGNARQNVFIKFQAHRYCHRAGSFIMVDYNEAIPLNKCLNMGQRVKSEIMTDGSGIISREAATKICKAVDRSFDALPAVYQGRIGFAKGLWILDPYYNPKDSTAWIEIRDSQWKAEPCNGFTFHFNLCRISRPASSSQIGKQLIPLLVSRGVSTETICKDLENYISFTIQELNTQDPVRLVQALTHNSGSLQSIRKAALDRMASIVHNPSRYRSFKDDPQISISEFDSIQFRLTPDSLDAQTLSPTSTEEQVVTMLASGFSPNCRIIVDKLRKIKETRIHNAIKFKIPVPESTYVYAIPDPTGTLKENEAFIRFSDFRDFSTGIRISSLEGPVLVSRSPNVAPIDAQKVNLVENEVLAETYFDVLVCSIQGQRSLLSLLSGGDYDGDQVILIWQANIVEQFQNAHPDNYPPLNIERLFEDVQGGTIDKHLIGLYNSDSKAFVRKAQDIQLSGLFKPYFAGKYSYHHSTAEYILGSDNPLTLKIGEIYVKCLDAPKAGIVLKAKEDAQIFKELQNELKKVKDENGKLLVFKNNELPIPRFLQESEKRSSNDPTFKYKRNGNLHVLDALLKVGYDALRKYKTEIDDRDKASHKTRFLAARDSDLSKLFADQKRLYEKKNSIKGSMEIWIGVLRPMQRAMMEVAENYRGMVLSTKHDREQDNLLKLEYGGVLEAHKDDTKKKKVQLKYAGFTYEKAFQYVPEEQDLKLHHIDIKEYHQFISAYLEGVGPFGYSLLKASCLSMCVNPEAFVPYEVAFREICFLKALACQAKSSVTFTLSDATALSDSTITPNCIQTSNSAVGLVSTVSSNLTVPTFSRVPHAITATCFLANVVKTGIVQKRKQVNDGEGSVPI
ncbi:hypothetical protein O181_046611 [Austropuccinia psidii MF-1]|uniref:RNA-dependent RNA polymerase n=1 Tax=Austropuccinia psidii MF-1 TaxID=1389203 RepID=A0A9Q3DM96_9BASI|nr:hypothetical protein [Austropuccinia psidii MF-1]